MFAPSLRARPASRPFPRLTLPPGLPLLALLLAALAVPTRLLAQSADSPNDGLGLTPLPPPQPGLAAFQLSWWGRAGHIYLVEHSADLHVWRAFPDYFAGADSPAAYGVAVADAARFFARTRRVESSLAAFESGDFDGDGLSTAQEVSLGLNPFARDTDRDGLPDGWEFTMNLSPLAADALADPDGDGVPNQEDARPRSAAVGRLTVSIAAPTNGGNL